MDISIKAVQSLYKLIQAFDYELEETIGISQDQTGNITLDLWRNEEIFPLLYWNQELENWTRYESIKPT